MHAWGRASLAPPLATFPPSQVHDVAHAGRSGSFAAETTDAMKLTPRLRLPLIFAPTSWFTYTRI